MKNKLLVIPLFILIFIIAIGLVSIYSRYSEYSQNENAETASELSPNDIYKNVIDTLYAGINQAKAEGNYRCCIEPACTMCYISGNKWNYNTPGTCACDDFIARGEDPCPQCMKGERTLEDLHSEDNTYCDINASIATCGGAN